MTEPIGAEYGKVTKLEEKSVNKFVKSAVTAAFAAVAAVGVAAPSASATGATPATAPTGVKATAATAAGSLVWCRDVLPLGNYSDHYAKCAQVIKVNTFLGVRDAPRYGARIAWKAYNGQWLEVDGCWVYGDGAADNPSYKVWAAIYSAGGYKYVSDWYLNSGNIRAQLPHC